MTNNSSDKMFANAFTVQLVSKSAVNIDVLKNDLGNIPRYCVYDGSDCREYLLCLDAMIDVKKLCEKYNYMCGSVHKIEIDKDLYNNNYEITPPAMDGDSYILEKCYIVK